MIRKKINVMWFKRDLRVRDNIALCNAIVETQKSPDTQLLIIYIFEPSLISDPHYDVRHWRFVVESLSSLNSQLSSLDLTDINVETHKEWPDVVVNRNPVQLSLNDALSGMCIFHGEVLEVFKALVGIYTIKEVFSHEETGLKVTYDRDLKFAAYCEQFRIKWNQFPNIGVVRKLKNKAQWLNFWKSDMATGQQHPDLTQLIPLVPDEIWFSENKGGPLPANWFERDENFQQGGEVMAHFYLDTFLQNRVRKYTSSVSKPLESVSGCSRLSPYIAWGCLSMRQVYQATLVAKSDAITHDKDLVLQFNKFLPRLKWQSMFIQEFESQDFMEFQNVNRGFENMVKNINQENYVRWSTGFTGYPLVDACMRCLIATGYINFRMRAMLVSFLTHHLFQDWKSGAKYLASLFTDFEPGLHYAQIQMQSGMGSQQTVRVYNPIKQSFEHDPDGTFIRNWVPELVNCSKSVIHTPWTMTLMEQDMNKVKIGIDYPHPVVDIVKTGNLARLKLYKPRIFHTN